MTTKESIAINTLKSMSTPKLIELWDTTETQEMTPELAKVRGWIMEALEAKNPAAFDKWIDNYEGSPAQYFN